MALIARRLPGIRVDVAPPPAAEALPRMDVAVLVGFASTGPLHTAVPIESVAQFSAVFGGDAPLAWDAVLGERVRAFLGPAVRAFFANGGRRCWVVRVARVEDEPRLDAAAAKANAFAIPGVLSLDAGGVLAAATAQARCEGSWSDALRVGAALQKRTIALEGAAAPASPSSGRLALRSRIAPRVGDVLEFDDEDGRCAFAIVEGVAVDPDPAGPYAIEAVLRAAFERIGETASPIASPPAAWAGVAQVAGFGPPVPATLFPAADADGPASVRFDAPMPASLEAGHWVRWSDGGTVAWLRMDQIDRDPAFTGSPAAMDTSHVMATATGPAWRELGAVLPFALADVERAHVLALELRVDDASGDAASLAGVGLTPAHAKGWWLNWTDADFYRPSEDIGAGAATQPVPAEVPRFPLARAPQALPLAWIPLGVEPLFGASLGRLPDSLTALERDGLSLFDASIFLDPELAASTMQEISAVADTIRFLRQPTRPLRGMHAAWSIGAGGLFNETTLLAIPDAIHLGWRRRDPADPAAPRPPSTGMPPSWHTHRGACAKPPEGPLQEPDFGEWLDCATRLVESPVLRGPAVPVPPGAYRLEWDAVQADAAYVLSEATQPDFGDARVVYSGPDTEYIALNPREGTYYYQVYAQVGPERSAGSNALAVVVRADEWIQEAPLEGDGSIEAQWLAVHRAALRMAAAGGELFAALAMPRHFRTREALRYAARLRAVREPGDFSPASVDRGIFAFNEAAALSYGALYFPWLQSQLRTGAEPAGVRELRVIPPDGVALGVLAARATARGAWIAAANEPMNDVVALTPPIASGDRQALQDAQVNLVRNDPRGFLTLSADTLSREVELRPINVRRLLILLRRLALRRGVSYVFEPNGPALRRAVQRGFDTLMGELFRRGAFAGKTPDQSFRVVTDGTINRPQDADAGRFIVELRVAPSIPMRFISILLAQDGPRLAVTEEL